MKQCLKLYPAPLEMRRNLSPKCIGITKPPLVAYLQSQRHRMGRLWQSRLSGVRLPECCKTDGRVNLQGLQVTEQEMRVPFCMDELGVQPEC